jgi:hypothetical protein
MRTFRNWTDTEGPIQIVTTGRSVHSVGVSPRDQELSFTVKGFFKKIREHFIKKNFRKKFFGKMGNCSENSPEKETEIESPARQLQRKCPAHGRKKEKPSDNQDDDCDDERQKSSLGSILFHALTF